MHDERQTDMRDNKVKSAIRSGGTAFGVALTVTDPLVAEMIGGAGLDFVMVDTEHAPVNSETLQNQLIALRTAPGTNLVRVPHCDPVAIGLALDLGAEGVVIPGVVDGASCAAAVATTRYPPAGVRGFGPRRAARLEGGRSSYIARADEEILTVVMVESPVAVGNIDEILATPGLDLIMVGPADLAVAMGHLSQLKHPDVDAAIETVAAACARHKVPFGIFAAAEPDARRWTERGAAFVVIGADLQFLDQGLVRVSSLAADLRPRPASPVPA
jgi:2-keto-3-deoxy-L-rhamnonate aldolase RhmA